MINYNLSSRGKTGLYNFLSVTFWIILINVFLWFVIMIFSSINPDFIKYFALRPASFVKGEYLWTIITSMFSHFYSWHIFANMITLLFVGGFIEKILGRKRYFMFYLISGIVASLVFVFLSVFFGQSMLGERFFGSPEILALGASGAIFGLAGLVTILVPRMKVLIFFVIPMPIWMAMVFFLGFFWVLSAFAGLPIGNSAHFGGFLAGIVYGIYLKNKYKRKTEYIRKIFS